MNILFLAEPSYPRHQGGAGRGTHLLAAALHRRGHEVRIVCQCVEATEIETLEGVEVHRINWDEVSEVPGRAGEIATAQAILLHLERNVELAKVDVIFDSGGFLSFFPRVAYDLKRRYGTAFVVQFRYLVARHLRAVGGRAFDEMNEAALNFESSIQESSQCFPSRFADEVLCVSHEDAEYVAASHRPASGPHVLPEPVEPLVIDAESAAQVRKELVPPGAQLLFFGGRINDSMKGGAVVCSAFERILKVRPNTRLLLLLQEENWLEPYRRFGSAVITRPWVRDRLEFATLLRAVDVLLMPSAYEPFGTLCAEALQVGCPVVATAVGGLKDQIVHGENGFLVNGDTERERAEALAECTLRILADPQLSSRLAKAGVLSARAFAAELIAARAEAICERAMARARATMAPRGTIVRPALSALDEDRYLNILGRHVSSESESLGRAALAGWAESATVRCTGCTRARLAEDTLRLMRLGRASRRWFGRFHAQPAVERRQAIDSACPLGLLQKHAGT
jgi:glycosyltransferase involved in cell wall biosynthesis